jgi:hypothetical protein
MKLKELLRDGTIPQIGFGPGGMGYSSKMKKKRTGISLFIYKVENKLYRDRNLQNSYVGSISNALKIILHLTETALC